MALTLNSRPQAGSGTNLSTFNSVHLPITYELESDLFPVNTADTTFSVTSVADNALGILVTTSGNHGYTALNWVTHTGFSQNYNGNFQILTVPSATTYTVGLTFGTTDTGNSVRYYNNYHVLVRLYAGLPSYHARESEKPLRLINTLRQVPDTLGLVKIDVADLIKQDIELNYDFANQSNIISNITGAYIQYAESYDQSNGTVVSTNVTSFVTDNVAGCTDETELVTNGDFASGLTGWSQIDEGGTSPAWTSASGGAQVVMVSDSFISDLLVQDIDFDPLLTYELDYDFTDTGVKNRVAFFLYNSVTTDSQLLSLNKVLTSPIIFTPNGEYDQLRIRVQTSSLNTDTVLIDNVSIISSDCKAYIWGANLVNQFRNANGGNSIGYLQSLSEFRPSLNLSPIVYPDKYFEVSYLVPDSVASSLNNIGNSYIQFVQYDENGVELDTVIKFVDFSKNDGVYRTIGGSLNRDIIPSSLVKKICYRLINLPENLITDADFGTFEDDFANWSAQVTAVNESRAAGGQSGSFSLGFGPRTSFVVVNPTDIVSFVNSIQITEGSEYELSMWVYLPSTAGITNVGNSADANVRYNLIAGLQSGQTVEPISMVSIGNMAAAENKTFADADIFRVPNSLRNSYLLKTGLEELTSDTWIELKSRITAVNDVGYIPTLKIEVVPESTISFANVALTDAGSLGYSMLTDTWKLEGPIVNISEEQCAIVDHKCTNQDFHLVWLNSQGAWDSHNFSAVKESVIDMVESNEIYRNPSNTWPTDFINGPFAHDFISSKPRKKYLIRSKPLTKSQVDVIEQCMYSIKCYRQESFSGLPSVTFRGVNVSKNSLTKYQDDDKLIILSLEVMETDFVRVQRQ